jgi:hypothetical protein
MEGMMKYEIKIIDCPDQGKVFYHVYKKEKLIKTFFDKDDAFDYVQSLIEDDNWHAMNR